MAAFEQISSIFLRQFTAASNIGMMDIRYAVLPFDPPDNFGFNPRKHRSPRNPITPSFAYINVARLGFGPGLLAIPLAVSQAGYVLGPIMCILTGLLLIHTQCVLLNCMYETARQLRLSRVAYKFAFRMCLLHGPPLFHCLGHHGPGIISFFMILSQTSICTVFVIFTSDSVRDICDFETSAYGILIMLVPFLFFQSFFRTLMSISQVAMAGNFFNVAGIILVFYFIGTEPHKKINLEWIHTGVGFYPFLVAFGVMLFNMSALAVILEVDKKLEHPELMVKPYGVIVIGVMVPSVFAAIFGFFGYRAFGTMDENILRSLPYDDIIAMICIGLYLMTVALTYPMQCYPGIQIIMDCIEKHDPDVKPSHSVMKKVLMIIKPLFVVVTCVITYFVPFQAPFVAFSGSLCTTILAIVFPAMMELCLLYPDRYGKKNWVLIKDILLIIFGTLYWIFGVYESVYLIYLRIVAIEGSAAAFDIKKEAIVGM